MNMNEVFRQHVESLHPSFERLLDMNPRQVIDLPPNEPSRKDSGIYLFSEGKTHLYVGRTNRLRTRIQEHGRPSSGHNSAPFAFLLAREKTGKLKASYCANGSRTELEQNPKFANAFNAAKKRVRSMNVRYVEECDPMRQALLEMYVALALETPHNSFENH